VKAKCFKDSLSIIFGYKKVKMQNNEITYPDQEKSHEAFKVHKVLDAGFVRLVDCMPSPTDPESITADAAMVQAARVSYGKGTKTINEDAGLISYLIKNRHTTPLEMVEMKFHCRMPMFIARQWIRHRTASVNEYSARYSQVPDLAYIPDSSRVLGQSKTNKQNSSGSLDSQVVSDFIGRLETVSSEAHGDYEEFLEKGVSRETARMFLPVNFYTEWYWKIDMHNLFHFLSLRADSHAQYEIRVYAEKMLDICKQIAPIATEAFINHRMNSVTFSGDELDIIRSLMIKDSKEVQTKLDDIMTSRNWSIRRKKEFTSNLSKIVVDLQK